MRPPAHAPAVTLTFDNGPDPDATPGVLDVLRRRGLRATFFVVGQHLADPARRALAQRAHAEGHWIGNHTFSHGGPLGDRQDRGHAVAEIGRTQDLIGELAHPDRLFRPVGGGGRLGRHLLSLEARDYLAAGGHTVVLWSAVPGDWRDPDGWPDHALEQCLAQPRPVLVLHDIAGGAMRHLDAVLGRMADAGIAFRQDFPAAGTPMRGGVAGAGLADIVTADGAGSLDPARPRPAA
ncbi:polysaccharide deacetylase family protein [Roseomonas sp. CECT 9278]|uniref:polysaccharide deacetylase family protein n=1 Tax=Roseomonas sp. CECT 9278 TaxID=2845823 RepID=UPI001E557F8D|nr:polysaccharide deacetylase family protein [Roseomonas sp. CECT 9278]CAH0282460.1 Peptidoglycan-N-acetylglucosamine deacetylase [Roseomonas sp. CECT 9278]